MANTSKNSRSSMKNISVSENSQVGVRRIKNGYIVSQEGSKGKGKSQQYFRDEYFSPTKPNLSVTTGMKFGKK